MLSGYVKLFRSIQEWEHYKDPKMFKVFIHLLLNANIERGSFKGSTIERGQVAIGRKALSDQTGLSVQEVRTVLDKFLNSGEITIIATNKFSIITLCNYEVYNAPLNKEQPASNQQKSKKSTSKSTSKKVQAKQVISKDASNFNETINQDINQQKSGDSNHNIRINNTISVNKLTNIDIYSDDQLGLFPENKSKSKKAKTYTENDWVFVIAIEFRNFLKENILGLQNIKPSMQKWAQDFEHILIDKASNDKARVLWVFEYFKATEFWWQFIHSPAKFDLKFANLNQQAVQKKFAYTNSDNEIIALAGTRTLIGGNVRDEEKNTGSKW